MSIERETVLWLFLCREEWFRDGTCAGTLLCVTGWRLGKRLPLKTCAKLGQESFRSSTTKMKLNPGRLAYRLVDQFEFHAVCREPWSKEWRQLWLSRSRITTSKLPRL